MSALANPQYERFAQELAKGARLAQAYAEAGFSPNRSNAYRLAQKANIRQRVKEIRQQLDLAEQQVLEKIVEKHALTKEAVLEELISIGFANLADFIDVSGPEPVFALQNAPREKLAAVRELTTERQPNGKTRIRLKFWDKKSALIDLGKHLGLFKELKAETDDFVTIVQRALAVPLDQIPPPPWAMKDVTPPRKKGE